ncbi:uncharacterized protein LOC136096744 [Hydra vulgaris]|uniref:uncharacterized protein LOC136096744 n=1 Tax=Hydra vulgaris TaxID=6087 RepID=UPI0032EA7D30
MNESKKRKGGAQKLQKKNQKMMKLSANKCLKISDFIPNRNPDISKADKKVTTKSKNDVQIQINSNNNTTSTTGTESEDIKATNEVLNSDDVAVENLSECTQNEIQVQIDSNISIAETVSHHPACDSDMVVDQGVIIVEQNIDWFSRPPSTLLNKFFEIHLVQTTRDPIIVKSFVRKNGTNRKWLSYSEGNDALYCSICLAFLPTVVMSSFVSGMTDRRHIHQRVNEHEKSASHNECTENYFQHVSRSNVSNLLFSTQISVRQEQVQKRRLVLLRVSSVNKNIWYLCQSAF